MSNVLSISADRRLADPASDAAHRQDAYRAELGGLTILVLGATQGIIRQAEALHAEHPFTAVTSQDAFRTGWVAWRISRRLRIPWLAQVHTDVTSPAFRRQSVKTFAHWLCARFLLPRAHAIRTVSARAARGIRRWVGKGVPITVLPIAWRPEHIEAHARPVAPVVLMASRLTGEKRMEDGLEAFARVRKHIPDARLHIAGDGPLRSQLETQCSTLGIADAVQFLGWRNDVPQLMREASVFVLCSSFEGYGTVTAEAQAAGCPVVMTDVGAAGELVQDDVSGIVVPVGDVHALAEGIIRILRDTALANRYSEAAVAAVRFLPTFPEYVNRYAALFTRLGAPRVLFVTQSVNEQDPLLGFVCRWLTALAARAEHVTVVCLRMGRHALPGNVTVFSLGKEQGVSRLRYVLNFYRSIWRSRNAYDTVFVHMNQVYVLLGWPLWRMMGKRILLWRNHPEGNWRTKLAGKFANVVMYTSPQSYTARLPNATRMPVGIDTEFFRRAGTAVVEPGSVLCLGRISPVKRIELLLEATALLRSEDFPLHADIIGSPGPKDHVYADKLKRQAAEAGIAPSVSFSPGVSPDAAPALYNAAWVVVNTTPSGSLDKTILEAMACETPVLVSNRALASAIDDRCIFAEGDAEDLTRKLRLLLGISSAERQMLGQKLREYVVRGHSLEVLLDHLMPFL